MPRRRPDEPESRPPGPATRAASASGPYRNPGARHFLAGARPGDDAASARLRDRAGSLRPLAGIDELIGQAERQPDAVAEKTYAAALIEYEALRLGAEAGRAALAAFAEARGFDAPPGPAADADAADPAAVRAAVEGEYREALAARDARIAELEARAADLSAQLDDLTAPPLPGDDDRP